MEEYILIKKSLLEELIVKNINFMKEGDTQFSNPNISRSEQILGFQLSSRAKSAYDNLDIIRQQGVKAVEKNYIPKKEVEEKKWTDEDIIKAIDIYRKEGLNVDKTLSENVEKLKTKVLELLTEYKKLN